MSFKVKDLAVNLPGPGFEDDSTCTTMTKPTGSPCTISLFAMDDGDTRRRSLSALRSQLHRAMARA
jgi:hypothetical protein